MELKLRSRDIKNRKLLSLERVYNPNLQKFDKTVGNFSLNYDESINPATNYNTYNLQSNLYNSKREACEKGWEDISNRAYLGQLQNAQAIYNKDKDICDIYEDSTIKASLLIKDKNNQTKTELIVVKNSDDSEYVFFKDKQANYQALTKEPIQLEKTADGYKLTLPNDTVKEYNSKGKLAKIKNLAQSLDIEYNQKGKIKKITNSFDQSIRLYYNDKGLLTKATSYDDTNTTYTYNDKNLLTKVTYPDNSTKSYEYDSDNNLIAIKDADGNIIQSYEYDSNKKIISLSQANGANKREFIQEAGKTIIKEDDNQKEYRFVIQHSKAKIKEIEDDEGVESYSYDLNGYPKEHINKLGVKTITTYNQRGLLVSKIENASTKDEKITLKSYHDKFHKPTKVVKAGVAILYEYNDKGLLTKNIQGSVTPSTREYSPRELMKVSIRSLDAKTTSFEYSDKGLLTSTTAPNGAVNKTYYDAQGNPTINTNPLGFETKSEFDKAGRPTKTTDANGIVTTTKYDLMGRVLEQTTDGKTTKYEYDSNGRLIKTIYPDGLETYSIYDISGNIIESGDNQGSKTLNEYDKNNNLIKTQSFKDNTLTYQSQSEYDSKNRLIAQIDGLGNKTTYTYNQKGQKIKTIDPLNRVTKYEYDELGRVSKEIKPDNTTTTYTYNKDGLKTKVVTPNNSEFKFEYDSLNRVTQKINPDRGTTTYTYDISDNIKKECDSKDNCIEYEYDLLNRKTKETFSDGTTITYEYDQGANAKGKLTKVTDNSGSTEFAYDKDGNIITKTQNINNQTFTTTYTYNDEGKLTSQTLPSNKTIEYSYNQQGELTSISIDGDTLIENIKTSNQGLLSYTYPNNKQHQRVYDTAGKLTKLIYPNYTKEITYNKVSNITNLKINNNQKSFNYDLVDRLISYDNNQSDYQRFSYDDNGNRVSLNQEQNISATLNYKELSNILTKVSIYKKIDTNTTQKLDEYNLTYDKNGNLINDTIHTYSYDNKNRLIAIDNNISYTYNYKNQRVSKTINNQTTYFIYDDYKLMGEYDSNGDMIKEYIYLNDTPIAILTPNNTYYIYSDHIDTPRAVTDTNNNIIWKWESKPFGETKPNQDPDQDGNTFTLNLRFPGQYADSESGLYYNFNRYYSPALGRYITSDPIGFEGGINTYLYTGGNPVGGFDAEGLFAQAVYLNPIAYTNPIGWATLIATTAVVAYVAIYEESTWWGESIYYFDPTSGRKIKHPKTGEQGWIQDDGSIWVKDRAGLRGHGGSRWKRWNNKRD